MTRTTLTTLAIATALGGAATFAVFEGPLAQGRSLQTPPVPITVRDTFDVPAADAQTERVVAAANAFLAILSDEERASAVFAFDDNAQRANWSNFPDGAVRRGGIKRGDMTDEQILALDALLAEVLSADGLANVRYQLAADDAVGAQDDVGPAGPAEASPDGTTDADERTNADGPPSGRPSVNFGSDYYYVSFLGEPAVDAPFVVQFGGHHLAINALFVGADASYSPMLTGGEPLRITYEGQPVTITAKETTAATAFLASLDDDQRELAVRGTEPIDLVLGPGEFGTTVAPEGIKGSDLSDVQQALLLDVIAARLGFINPDDFAVRMETVRAGIDDTYLGWWGPAEPLGAAYYRITGPSVAIEYAPQDGDGDATDHAHNMYRDPTNDYGAAWIASGQ